MVIINLGGMTRCFLFLVISCLCICNIHAEGHLDLQTTVNTQMHRTQIESITSTSSVQSDKQLNLTNLSKRDFKFEDINKYGTVKNKKVDGILVSDRIEALKQVYACINRKSGAIRPSFKNLSKEQRKSLELVFDVYPADSVQKVTKGNKFSSIYEFQTFIEYRIF